jgi:hypothetical protein
MQLVLVFVGKCCANPGRCEVFLLLKVSILPLATIFFIGFWNCSDSELFFFFFLFFLFYHFYRLKKSTLIEEMKICRNTDL